ncbi:MAG: M28 family peptidase [Chitinophagaceae bacterium]
MYLLARFCFIAVLVLSICSSKAQSLEESLINHDSIKKIVYTLSADSFNGRFTGTFENAKAAAFIAEEFKKSGLKKVSFLVDYYDEVDTKGNNVVGILKGKSKPNEFVIFSCHYDHIGTLRSNPYPFLDKSSIEEKATDSIFNGANDNASGVSAVISLAKYYASINDNQRSILFIAFTGEELGLLGSKHFAKILNPDSVIAVINFDMIGRSYNNRKRPFITGSIYSNLRQIINKSLSDYDNTKYGKNYFRGDQSVREALFYRLDNFWFAINGIPAHTVMCTLPDDKFYHQLKDEASTLDYTLIYETVKAVAIGCNGIVENTITPYRLNKKDLRKF